MKLKDIAVWWSSPKDVKKPGMPAFVVLEHASEANEKYGYLFNSIGRCFGGWRSASPVDLATHIMFTFHWAVTRDGVDPKEAHEELMKIDEYAAWHCREDGPFRDAYHAWLDRQPSSEVYRGDEEEACEDA